MGRPSHNYGQRLLTQTKYVVFPSPAVATQVIVLQILGWAVLVRIDGLTYSFLGDQPTSYLNGTVNVTDTVITPTQTVVAAQAGPMQVNLTFLNPIEVRTHLTNSVIPTDNSFSARRLGQAINPVLVPGLIYEIAGRCSP